MKRFLAIAGVLGLMAVKSVNAADNCDAEHGRDGQATVAESRQETISAATKTTIDPGTNGGIRIHGWNQQGVLVKACVRASAGTEQVASALLKEIRIVRGPGNIEPDGPADSESQHWSVSYEIWMPNASNVEAHSLNGGITIEGIEGEIRFHAQNGGVNLIHVGGDVEGATQNGGLTVQLAGTAWRGSGLRAETQNGGVNMTVPEGYSAQVEASTVNGGMHVDFPVELSGKTVRFDLGSGGALLQVKTVNGGVRIGKA
jgi:hypothetical protein